MEGGRRREGEKGGRIEGGGTGRMARRRDGLLQ